MGLPCCCNLYFMIFREKKNRKANENVENVYTQPQYLLDVQIPAVPIDYLDMVQVPDGLGSNEWIAMHTLGLFHNINHQYGALSELCTSESCRTMTGPGGVVFHWQDDRGKRIHCSAPQYCDSAMTYCQQRVTNTDIFPTKYDQEFPANFLDEVKTIMGYLWSVVCHIYHRHWIQCKSLNINQQLTMIFLHLYHLCNTHHLLTNDLLIYLHPLLVALNAQILVTN